MGLRPRGLRRLRLGGGALPFPSRDLESPTVARSGLNDRSRLSAGYSRTVRVVRICTPDARRVKMTMTTRRVRSGISGRGVAGSRVVALALRAARRERHLSWIISDVAIWAIKSQQARLQWRLHAIGRSQLLRALGNMRGLFQLEASTQAGRSLGKNKCKLPEQRETSRKSYV